MRTALTIGDFSRMTHLSVKTLRHYHQVGLLEPAEVDPHNGYRYYAVDQVPTAQIIRRFRDLDMPVEQVRAVLTAPDLTTRNALITEHLNRLENQLAQTRNAVSSLRNLLEAPRTEIAVEHRSVPATPAMAIAGSVGPGELGPWWSAALTELRHVVDGADLRSTGPSGGLYANELFENEAGDVLVYLPVARPVAARGRVRPYTVPAAELVITRHEGSHADSDIAYGALGTYVTEHALGVNGPVRESYLVGMLDTPEEGSWQTEIGWPVFQTTAG